MARRRLLGAIALATAATLTVAACGSDDDEGGSTGASGKPEYTIGFQGPLSGSDSQLGVNGVNGVKTAIAEWNENPAATFTLKLVEQDDEGSPDKGPTAAAALIDNSDVLAVVGPMFSGATKASEPAFSDAGLLSVSPSATNPDLTKLGFTTFYRVIPNDAVQGEAVADYITKALKPTKVFSLDDASEYGTGLSKVLEGRLTSNGTTFVHDSINPTTDYTSEATKIISENPEVVYYSGYYSTFALLTKALKDKGYTGKIMSGDGSLDPQYIEQAGAAAAEGAVISCPCLLAQADPEAADFVASYQKVTGEEPGTYSAEAYDVTNAIIETIKGLGDDVTRESIAGKFGSIDIQGLTKQIKFTPEGEVTDAAVLIYEVKDGKLALVGTVSELTAG
ncbi:branched-chain amino acid ABC transporter substrate-binding protein [Frankia sp. CNm7]|uniref:Branched-chain amino acid ABC transporter substrate-binding protein n=1 Tax=Frankia nepalensis TaxID=1836974 RepID=A0A937RP79_9ACTN|nr:branched-chain amino acid ABC transporter substrate-binding protein [Frankia nepalensis]MBL7499583.1 branched-chain amino acid ABC transporter substrate-binding protein [Frankia nepalensis]MBL7513072.1 branched-chain amino acid ABC transporter substrate-binding protein [Frankia nepalensis]MBL7522908.1 branched-chain amino acid ABC transporter substrate-binding protein [Frankia nepalensis]MBL7633785.1 branched-chain amino acid ABC transporter substrate-binding protein [Frankia nepalensis]